MFWSWQGCVEVKKKWHFFFIALKLVLLTRVSKVMNGKKVHLPRLQPRSQVLSLARSLRKAGRREPWERGCSGFFHNFGGRWWRGEAEFVLLFFFFQVCSYQIRPQLAGLSYKNPSLGVYLFSEKVFVSLWHNLSPRDVNDKVAIITILIIKK